MRLVIVGGVAGGMSAATRARRLSESAEIIVLEAGQYVSFANCGLPYHLGGEISERNALLLHTPETLAARANLDVRLGWRVTAIDAAARSLTAQTPAGETTLSYDALILSPGAEGVIPPLPGITNPALTTLRTIPDMDRAIGLATTAQENALPGRPARAVVLGGGFIGLETVEALTGRGVTVDLVDLAPQVLPLLDSELSGYLAEELYSHGVGLHWGAAAQSILSPAEGGDPNYPATVTLSSGKTLPADLVILSVGVRPSTDLATSAGLDLAANGRAIAVDERGRTSNPHIWAVGDATAVIFADGREAPVLLAGPANRQGRRAADDIFSHPTPGAAPVLGTAVVRLFGQVAAVTGAGPAALQATGTEYFTVRLHSGQHAGYYPGVKQLHLHGYFSPTGQLLGAAAVGPDGADKRIDVLATAVRAGFDANDLAELELCYAPPFGSAKDPVNMLGFIAQNILSGLSTQIDPADVSTIGDNGIILDVRSKSEWNSWHLDDSLHIPLPELRARLTEVQTAAKGRDVYVHCASGLRSYLAARILTAAGLVAHNVSGGATSLRAVATQN